MATKQKQSQSVRVTVNLAEKKKPRKKRGRYRRMKEPKMDVSRLAALQAPRSNVQVIRYEYPVLPQMPQTPQAPVAAMVRTVAEPHAQPAVVGQNQNAFGTRNTGAPIPDSSARAVIDTPSELEGKKSSVFIPVAMPSLPFSIGAKKITVNKSGAERAAYGSKKKRKGEDSVVADIVRVPEMGGGARGGGGGRSVEQIRADLGPPPFYERPVNLGNIDDLRIATEEKKMLLTDMMRRA